MDRAALHAFAILPVKALLETTAIPTLLEGFGEEGGLKDAIVSIDEFATNAMIASAIRAQGPDYLLAVKANQLTLRAEVEAASA